MFQFYMKSFWGLTHGIYSLVSNAFLIMETWRDWDKTYNYFNSLQSYTNWYPVNILSLICIKVMQIKICFTNCKKNTGKQNSWEIKLLGFRSTHLPVSANLNFASGCLDA